MIIYQGVTLHDCSPGYTMKYHNQQVIASVGKCTWRRLQLNRGYWPHHLPPLIIHSGNKTPPIRRQYRNATTAPDGIRHVEKDKFSAAARTPS